MTITESPKLKTPSLLEIKALKRKAFLEVPFCPHEPHEKQRLFLSLDDKEALFGGAGGGGKTDALLMAALQYIEVPGYSALLLRRTFADLAIAGSVMDRAKEWLDGKPGVTWNERDHKFTFECPGGGQSRLTFGYCDSDNDRFRYKSAEFQFIGFDELTTFTEVVYTYLFSRLRRPKNLDVPLRMRAATNPGDVGHEWVKKRFISPGHPSRPFISSKISDNPFLDQESYVEALNELDEATRAQLKDGLWVTDSGQRVYKYTEKNLIGNLPNLQASGWKRAFVADLGGSEVKQTTGFALVTWHEHSALTFVEESWKEAGIIPSTLAAKFQEKIDEFGEELVCIIDAGALGVSIGRELSSRWGIPIQHAEKRDKRTFRRLLNGSLEKNETLIIESSSKQLLEEWQNLIYSANGLDEATGLPNHCSDAVLYGWRYSQAHNANLEPISKEPAYGTKEYWNKYSSEAEKKEREQIKKEHEENMVGVDLAYDPDQYWHF